MGDRSNSTQDRALSVEDDITVVLHKVTRKGSDSGDVHDECGGQGERAAERIHLQRRESREHDAGDARTTRRASGGDHSPEDSQRKRLCPRTLCVRGEPASPREGTRAARNKSYFKSWSWSDGSKLTVLSRRGARVPGVAER